MKQPTKKQVRFEVMSYKKEVTVKSLTRKQVEAIDLRSFHFCYAICFGVLGYMDFSGVWHDINEQEHSLGYAVGWPILQSLQLNPSIGLDKKTIVALTGIESLGNEGVLAQRIHTLRAIFGENNRCQRLIRSSRKGGFTIMWPSWASWIWVTPITY